MQTHIKTYLRYITVKWSQATRYKKTYLLYSFFWNNVVADDDDIVCYLTIAITFSSSSSSSSSSECCTTIGIMGTVLYLTLLGSKGSTTTCSVPLISARQYGQPWPSDSWKKNNSALCCSILFPRKTDKNKCDIIKLPLINNDLPSKNSDKEYIKDDHTVRCVHLYHFLYIFCKFEKLTPFRNTFRIVRELLWYGFLDFVPPRSIDLDFLFVHPDIDNWKLINI